MVKVKDKECLCSTFLDAYNLLHECLRKHFYAYTILQKKNSSKECKNCKQTEFRLSPKGGYNLIANFLESVKFIRFYDKGAV